MRVESIKLIPLDGKPLMTPFEVELYNFIHKFFPRSPQTHTQYNVLDLNIKHIILCFSVLGTIIAKSEKIILHGLTASRFLSNTITWIRQL
jgi:hypothetical protein